MSAFLKDLRVALLDLAEVSLILVLNGVLVLWLLLVNILLLLDHLVLLSQFLLKALGSLLLLSEGRFTCATLDQWFESLALDLLQKLLVI